VKHNHGKRIEAVYVSVCQDNQNGEPEMVHVFLAISECG
jgi:hypothetical protein